MPARRARLRLRLLKTAIDCRHCVASGRTPVLILPPRTQFFQLTANLQQRNCRSDSSCPIGAAMLAYLFWHRPYVTTTVKQYEEALLRSQQHLGQQHPPGLQRQRLIPCCGVALARQSARIRGLVFTRWLLGARSSQRLRCCRPGDECTRHRRSPDGRRALAGSMLWSGANQFYRSGLTRPRGIQGGRFSTRCASNSRNRHYGGVRWCSGQARSSLSSCRRASMSPYRQVGPRWPSSGCASRAAKQERRQSGPHRRQAVELLLQLNFR